MPSLDTQIKALADIRAWALAATAVVNAADAARPAASVSKIVGASESPAAFSVRCGRQHSLTWSVKEVEGTAGAAWSIVVTRRPAAKAPWTGYPRSRHTIVWNRERVERAIESLAAFARLGPAADRSE